VLAHRLAGRPSDPERLVGGLLSRHNLEQRHQRRRVEEMHADHALGSLGSACDRRHQQGGRVGRQHALPGHDLLRQLPEQLALELEPLGRGLDHQFAGTEVAEVQSGFEPLCCGVRRLLAPSPAGCTAFEMALDLVDPPVQSVRHRVVQQRSRA
jgi:hypothetical protein